MDNTVGSQLENVIIGTLLGDGFLEKNGHYCRLVVDHSAKQALYVQWLRYNLSSLPYSFREKEVFDKRTKKIYYHHLIRTHSLSYFDRYREMFYMLNKKRIPLHLPRIINPQILAVWIMDDGYKRNDCNALRLNTQSYSYDDHMIIQKSFASLSLESTIQRHKAGFVLYVPSRSMTKLREIVKPFIIESMAYKIA